MKRYFYILPVFLFTSLANAQNATGTGLNQGKSEPAVAPTTDKTVNVPPNTISSSQRATQLLGDNVIKSNYLYALEKMYPRYRKRQEKASSARAFKQQFVDMGKTLNTMGVTINSFKAHEPVSFFRVWPQIKPAAKLKIERGEQKDVVAGDVLYNWLILVPTTQVWTFTSNGGRPPRKLKRVGFQIVVALESAVPGQEQWTFIDGGTIKPQELRSMFPSLPQQLVLPPRVDSEIK